jgi:hypothetical protein
MTPPAYATSWRSAATTAGASGRSSGWVWRAVAYCVHPRVIALSFLPLVLMVALALGLGYLYWEPAIDAVRGLLESADLLQGFWAWLQGMGAGDLKSVVAPLIVIFTVTPVIVLLSLIIVAVAMTPSLVAMVAERRFAALERKKGGSLLMSLAWSLGSTLLAVVALVVSMPLWLVPPLILVLPPLIWGWLTYRVMVRLEVASVAELISLHRSAFSLWERNGFLPEINQKWSNKCHAFFDRRGPPWASSQQNSASRQGFLLPERYSYKIKVL